MRNLRHKVQINIASRNGDKQKVVSSTTMRLPQKLLKMVFGDFTEVLVISPGRTVEGIEIKEIRNGGEQYEEA